MPATRHPACRVSHQIQWKIGTRRERYYLGSHERTGETLGRARISLYGKDIFHLPLLFGNLEIGLRVLSQ
jgi:hypothetical protein